MESELRLGKCDHIFYLDSTIINMSVEVRAMKIKENVGLGNVKHYETCLDQQNP